jgi:hypothetical protein
LRQELNFLGFKPIYVGLDRTFRQLIELGLLFMHELPIDLDGGFNVLALSTIGYSLLGFFQLELMLLEVYGWSNNVG